MKTIRLNLSILHIPRPCSAILALNLAFAPVVSLIAVSIPGQVVWQTDGNNLPIKQCLVNEEANTCCGTAAAIQGAAALGDVKTAVDCAWITISTGNMRPGALLPPGFFDLMVQDPSPEIFSPVRLRYVLGYNIRRASSAKTAAGLPREIVAVNDQALTIAFRFADGESVGIPYVGGQSKFDHRLLMVDAQGWATAEDPAYYDLYPGDGTVYRFNAAAHTESYLDLVHYQDKTGRRETPITLDTQIIRDEMRTVRQVLAPASLADIIVTGPAEYRINFYNRHDIQEQPGEDGLYSPLPGITNALRSVIIRNPAPEANANHLQIIQQTGQYQDISDFTYQSEAEQWTLSKGNGLVRQVVENMWSDDRKTMLETKYTLDAANNRLDKQTTRFQLINGAYLITQKISDPDGHAHTTTYTRYTATTDGKKLGKIKTEQNSDGSWTRYEYDANGYLTAEITPWLDSPFSTADNPALNQATTTSYAPVDPADAPVYNDQRPRTITRKILGQTVSKTYYAYINGPQGELTEITEHARTPDAPYADTANLRTTRTYYGTNSTHAMNGRLATVQHPDNRLETHTYEYGNLATIDPSTFTLHPSTPSPFTPDPDGLAWRETVTHGTVDNPEGIPGKTTSQSRILDAYARDILSETHVKTASSYDRIAWTLNQYNDFTRLTATYKSDGTRETQTWGQNCCGTESRKTADGIETVFAYDPAGRRISETRLGHNGSPSLTQEYTIDATGRRLTTTLKGGDLTLVTASNTYDQAGNLTKSVDAQGITTTYEQGCCGLESTTIRAGLTNTTVRYADGRTHYTQQNGTRQQTYTYGLDASGHLTTTAYTGPEATNSPAWQRTTTDLLGRTIRTERPGFDQSGTGVPPVIATENTYNTQGQLISTSTKNEEQGTTNTTSVSLFAYNTLSEQTLTAQDLNTNGVIDLAGPDRVSGSERYFEQDASNDWWQVSVSKFYPNDNDATVVTNAIQKRRLTGLSAPKTSESISIDIRGNQTVSSGCVDRENKTVTQTVSYPDSTNNAVSVSVNGLLVSSTTKTGNSYTYGYDGLERRISTSDPRTGASIIHFNDKGQVDWVEDADTNRTTFAYDPATGRRTSTTDAMTNSVYTAYSTEGQMIGTWGSTYPVFYEYDEYDRMRSMYTLRDTGVAVNSYADFVANSTAFDKTT